MGGTQRHKRLNSTTNVLFDRTLEKLIGLLRLQSIWTGIT